MQHLANKATFGTGACTKVSGILLDQIVGRKFEEEKVLAIAKILYAALETFKTKGGM